MLNNIQLLCKERYYTNLIPITDKNTIIQFGNIFEELSELMVRIDSEYETIDALADIIVFSVSTAVHFNIDVNTLNIELGSVGDLVEAIKDMSVIALGLKTNINKFDVITILGCVIAGCLSKIEELSYDPYDVLEEVYREISSRVQDPVQKKLGRKNGEKWKKDINQPEKDKYKANYSRLGGQSW